MGRALCSRFSQGPPPAVSLEKSSSSLTPREPPAHGEQDSSGSFPTALSEINSVNFTTEPESNSETQGQDSWVSRSALPAIAPTSLHSHQEACERSNAH